VTDILYAGLCILTAGVDPACPEIPVKVETPAQVQPHKRQKDKSINSKDQENLEVLVNQSMQDSMDDEALN
jgi:hypothetical protein